MLDAFKRLIARKSAESEWSEVSAWAQRQRLNFKRVRDEGGGFVIDGAIDNKPWRLEWGPPQRQYIEGHELRIRMELGLSPNLQMLVLTQSLFETLERSAFESFTESTQTVIDSNAPEEMRWLVMFPKASVKAAKTVRQHFHFTGGTEGDAERWVEGPLAEQLEKADVGFLAEQPPFILMTLRGRVYLRMQLRDPDPRTLGGAVSLFQCAVAQAIRTAATVTDADAAARDWSHSDSSTAWQTLGPEPPKKP